MKIQAQFTHDKINHSQDNDLHMVVSLDAPAIDWVKKRPSLAILPVVDLSGSMAGEKLEKAKQSLLQLVDHLHPGDICGLFGFENRVHKLVDPKPCMAEQKDRLRVAINKLRPMGGTNLADGMLRGLEALQNLDLPPKFLHRLIMFTDGQPTVGITDKSAITGLLTENLGNITVSAFGYGDTEFDGDPRSHQALYGTCDQDFLLEFSKQGKGNYAYVQNPDAALSAFGKELGGLLSTYATGIRIEIEPTNGHRVTDVLSDVEHEKDVTGEIEVKIPDILAEENRNLVMAIKLDAQKQAHPRVVTVFNLKVSYTTLTQKGERETHTETTKAKVRFVKPGEEQDKPNKAIDEIVAVAQMANAQVEAEEKAKEEDYVGAALVMDSFREVAAQRGHAIVATTSSNISGRLGSASQYAGSQGYLRSMHIGTTRAVGASAMDAGAVADLQNMSFSLSNDAQESTSASFEDGGMATSGKLDLSGGENGAFTIEKPTSETVVPVPDGTKWTSDSVSVDADDLKSYTSSGGSQTNQK